MSCVRCAGSGIVGRNTRRVFYCTCLRGVLMLRRLIPTPRKQIGTPQFIHQPDRSNG